MNRFGRVKFREGKFGFSFVLLTNKNCLNIITINSEKNIFSGIQMVL